jgi:ProP effector
MSEARRRRATAASNLHREMKDTADAVGQMAISKSQARAHAAIAQLSERFPAVFTRTDRRPLKIGIHGELMALGFDRKLVVVALRSYCGSSGYLSALREGAARIGLDGQPTGVVTAEEEKIAAAQLTEKIARAKNRRLAAAARAATPASEATTARAPARESSGGPRRLSLSDLREAGRRRRA